MEKKKQENKKSEKKQNVNVYRVLSLYDFRPEFRINRAIKTTTSN